MSGCGTCSGRQFHSVGPTVAKQRSPNWMRDLLMMAASGGNRRVCDVFAVPWLCGGVRVSWYPGLWGGNQRSQKRQFIVAVTRFVAKPSRCLIIWSQIVWILSVIYSVSQKKVAPLKLFAIFSLRLSIFPWNFASLLPVYIHTCVPILVDLLWYLTKWHWFSFLIIFTVSSFDFQQVRLP